MSEDVTVRLISNRIVWDILSLIIPIAAVIVTAVLTSINSSSVKKKDAEKERYLKFYMPYIRFLILSADFIYNYGTLNRNNRKVPVHLALDELSHVDERSQEHIIKLYHAENALQDVESKYPGLLLSHSIPQCLALTMRFRSLTKSVLLEAQKISKKQKLPNLAKIVLDYYHNPEEWTRRDEAHGLEEWNA